ncbi:hypothetical protein DFS34DRAFT_607431 [Phlyctochytrium arcticum]|nr:hypothetical protein DFS34DRAFT_607431 [Phlyctochytrium arcticum]
MEDDGFTLVVGAKKAGTSRKNGSRTDKSAGPSRFSYKKSTKQTTEAADESPTWEELVDKVDQKRTLLRSGQYVEKAAEQWRLPVALIATMAKATTVHPKVEVVVYGLGSLLSEVSCWQLALLLEVMDSLKVHCSRWIYDPVMTESDRLAVERLEFQVIAQNEQAARAALVPTLFYMPHCGHALYNNVLRANWSPAQLESVVIVGNSFDAYSEFLPGLCRLEARAPYLARVGRIVSQIPIKLTNGKESRTVKGQQLWPEGTFNNTSVHFFQANKLHAVEQKSAFWKSDDVGKDEQTAEDDPELK